MTGFVERMTRILMEVVEPLVIVHLGLSQAERVREEVQAIIEHPSGVFPFRACEKFFLWPWQKIDPRLHEIGWNRGMFHAHLPPKTMVADLRDKGVDLLIYKASWSEKNAEEILITILPDGNLSIPDELQVKGRLEGEIVRSLVEHAYDVLLRHAIDQGDIGEG